MFFPCNCFPILFSLSNLFSFGTFPFLRPPDTVSRRFRKVEGGTFQRHPGSGRVHSPPYNPLIHISRFYYYND
jgi:hypothetical protein